MRDFVALRWEDNRVMLTLLLLLVALPVNAENWPAFRGPSRQGISAEKGIPVELSPTKNLAWVTSIPGEGWSSPIVWNGRVFVTTATDGGASCRLMSLDRDTGKVHWDREITRQATKRKEAKNSYASPTPVTDGKSVFAVCADGTVAAYDLNGAPLWVNRNYPHYSQHGLGSSPLLVSGMLIMARDGSAESGDLKVGWQKPWENSYLVALDANTGKQRWRGKRGLSRIAHVTPNMMEGEIISGAGDVVQAFEVHTGALKWTGRSQGEGVVPSIVIGDGLIYTCSGFEKPTIRAFRPGGAIAWEQTRGVPMISSLLHRAPYLYSVTTAGIAHCYRATDGEVVWQARLGGEHSASPVFVDGHIYFSGEDGIISVVRAGGEFNLVAKNDLGETIQASPAVSQGRLFIRTAARLYCFRLKGSRAR